MIPLANVKRNGITSKKFVVYAKKKKNLALKKSNNKP